MAQKKQHNPNKPTDNKQSGISSISGAIEKQLRDIHKTFVSKQGKGKDISSETFVDFVRSQRGGINILKQINAAGVQTFFDNIKQTGSSVATLSSDTGRKYFRQPGISEADKLDRAFGNIKGSLYGFSGKWDAFCRLHKLSFSETSSGIHLTDGAKSRSTIRTTADLHTAWVGFLAQENINNSELSDLLHHVPYVSTEHVMIDAIKTKVRSTIDPSLRSSWDSHMGTIDAYSSIQTVDQLMERIHDRTEAHPEQKDAISSTVIRNRDIYTSYQNLGGQGNVQGDFSERDRDLQELMGRNTTLAHASTYRDSLDHLEESINKATDTMNVLHPKIKSLFGQRPYTDQALRQIDSSFGTKSQSIAQQMAEYREHFTSEDTAQKLNAKEAYRKAHKELELARRATRVETVRKDDDRLASILAQGPAVHFDFSQLSKEDQCYLGYACARPSLEPRDEQANLYGLDKDRYTSFVKNIFDAESNEIRLPTDEGKEVVLPLRGKGFMKGGIHPDKLSFKTIEEADHLGFSLDVDVNDDNEEALRQLYPQVFFDVNGGGATCAPSYKVQTTHPETGKSIQGYLMNSLNVDDQTVDNHTNDTTEWILYSTPPTDPTNTYPGPTTNRTGINLGPDINAHDIQILDRSLPLNGDALNTLTLGWALGDRIHHPKNTDQHLTSSRGDMIDNSRINDETDTYVDNYEREQAQTENNTEGIEVSQEQFLKDFVDRIKGPQSLLDGLKDTDDVTKLMGHDLWMQSGTSNVPPKDVPFYVRCHISDVDTATNEIELTLHGTDNDLKSDEGRRIRFPMTLKTLGDWTSATDDSSVYLMPSFGGSADDLVGHKEDLVSMNLVDKESMATFGGLEFDKKGRKRSSDDKEITYFSGEGSFSPDDGKTQHNIPYTYEVKKTGPDSFHVKGPNGRYNRTMDMPTFLVFMSNRGLKGMTQEEKDAHEKRVLDPDSHKFKQDDGSTDRGRFAKGRYSIASIISFVKEATQKAKDGIDNYNKKQTEDMTDIILGKYGMYDKLAKITGSLGFLGATSDAFDNMHGDYIQERDKKTFDIINGAKDYLAQNPDGNAVVKGNIKGLLDDAAGGTIPTKRRSLLSAAGKYLYMLEDHGDAYGDDLRAHRGSGLWVKILCGQRHYDNYLKRAKDLQLKIDANPGDVHLLEEFADMESRYIHQTIADNPNFKRFYSKKFSDSVIGAKRKGNSSERIQKTTDIFGGQKDFGLNETLFGLKLKNGDIGKTVGHLKAMAMTATSATQVNKVRMYLLELMLSGIVLYQTNDATKNVLESIASKIGFIPGTWIKDPHQQHKIQKLLDYITDGGFSKGTGYNRDLFTRLNYGQAREKKTNGGVNFHSKYKNWIGKHASEVCDFLTLNDIKHNNDSNLLSIVDKMDRQEPATGPKGNHTNSEIYSMLSSVKSSMMSNAITGADRDLQNKHLFKSPLAIPNSVVKGQLNPDRNGQITGGGPGEISMKEVFWNSMNAQLPTTHTSGAEIFFIERFGALFSNIGNDGTMHQALLSARHHIKRGEIHTARAVLRGIFGAIPVSKGMNNIDPVVKDVLKKYQEFFLNNLGHIEERDLMRALNMNADIDFVGGGSLAKPYNPQWNWDNSVNKCPPNTLNKSLYSLKNRIRNAGLDWNMFFPGSGSSMSQSGSKEGKVVNLHPNRVPIENSDDIYGQSHEKSGKVIPMDEVINNRTSQEIQEALERYDEENNPGPIYGETG